MHTHIHSYSSLPEEHEEDDPDHEPGLDVGPFVASAG